MVNNKIINIAAISGSLKSTSSNTNILRAIAKIAPENVIVNLVEGLDSLPHFNPENEAEIESLTNFRQQLKNADGVIFSTPEYAYGVPGVLKNALDWLVSSGELYHKPVAAISASPVFSGGDKALASLLLTLSALGTNTNEASSLSIANIKNKISVSGEITDLETIKELKSIFDDLLSRISAE
jgi:chromate reductase, NAD(P)H dehydrogenase (quinone)